MHGLGNDFVVIDNMNGRIVLSPEQVIFLCDRHKGISADGVILVESSDKADCFMNYYNSDGTPAEMCGNGVRCTARFLKEFSKKHKEQREFKIETRAGVKNITLENDGTYSVNMGKPIFVSPDFPNENLEIENLSLNFVSMGNPHAVAIVKNINEYDLSKVGPLIENNQNFPNKINLEIVEEKNSNEFVVKVWERGCGATLACGTGACAVYAIAKKNIKNKISGEVKIDLPGGTLFLSENESGEILMRGPAENVYSGMVEI